MKWFAVILLILIPSLVKGQAFFKEFVFSNGWKVKKGDSVTLGTGSSVNKGFVYLFANTHGRPNLPPSFAGRRLKVVREYYSAFTRTVNLTLKDASGVSYKCLTEKALRNKELLPPPNYLDYRKNRNGIDLAYKDTIATPGAEGVLYERAIAWYRRTIGTTGDSLVIANKQKGTIKIDAFFPYHSHVQLSNAATKGNVYFTIKMSFSNNAYTYKLGDFVHQANNENALLYHDNHTDSYSFGRLTTAPLCPREKMYTYNGRRWSNKAWEELRKLSDSTAASVITSLKQRMQ
ncbi:MAG: DUF4468 domain-containing protein [Taibaiella sp.]|nr:DUF4468 domain-containing protein [Taibaiella sp.]